jgi:hypothetical protein
MLDPTFERQHCLAQADQLLGSPFTHRELALFVERERLHARLEYQSDIYKSAWLDCIQDGSENSPFSSIGGPDKRFSAEIPRRDYVVSESDRSEWLRGYTDCARYQYGEDWQTCSFGWAPVISLVR